MLDQMEMRTLEIEREKDMVTKGRDRFLMRQEGNLNPTTQNNPQKLISGAMSRVADAIRSRILKEETSGARKYCWYEDIKGLDVDLLAYLALNTCMESISLKASLTSCISRIGQRIELEHWSAGLKAHDSKLSKRIETQVTTSHNSTKYRVKAARIIAAKESRCHACSGSGSIEVKGDTSLLTCSKCSGKGTLDPYVSEPWVPTRQVKAAAPLINAVLEFSGIFDVWEKSTPKRTMKKMGMTQEASLALADMDHKASWLEPMFAPMIVPPTIWTAFDTGCYRDAVLANQVPLVRMATPTQRKALKHDISKAGPEGPEYLQALNAIQATPLDLNSYVVDAVDWAWTTGADVGDAFPHRAEMAVPPVPDNWDVLSDSAKKGYSIKCREIHEKNRDIRSQTAVMKQDLESARDLESFEEFYLPWNLDFRGRCYPVPHFNYHRDDHIKAMFQLGTTQQMTPDGGTWLAIHVANLGDFDKVSKQPFAARNQWTEDNSDWICRVGQDFKGTVDLWSKADKPFQFLAACNAWAKWKEYGLLYHCAIPTSLDGSNSGCQHYSAASLDEKDGALVNLTPSESPQDVYQSVADLVLAKVTADAQVEDEHQVFAKAWLKYGVTRKVCKRNTMTYAYSAVVYGFGEQLEADVMVPLATLVLKGQLEVHPFGETTYENAQAARYLAQINMDSIRQVIRSAADGMEFFKAIAGALAHEGKPVRWTTPTGFIAYQKYTDFDMKKVKLFLHDRVTHVEKRMQITVRERSKTKIKKRKSKSSISPNVIHSMDSSHLMKTVLLLKEQGVVDFFLIHDSFAATPAETDLVYGAVRLAFIEMYDGFCMYQKFLDEANQQLSTAGRDSLNVTIPKKGNLDLWKILESEYCFA